jgi:hypothetical protein
MCTGLQYNFATLRWLSWFICIVWYHMFWPRPLLYATWVPLKRKYNDSDSEVNHKFCKTCKVSHDFILWSPCFTTAKPKSKLIKFIKNDNDDSKDKNIILICDVPGGLIVQGSRLERRQIQIDNILIVGFA